ncbi:sensor histidine kinase [Catenovulum agarivorans DS-2]|uniref:histidine kinase n=1 Tax=Catenovulum agarivorans DS-2 TaxID=1328313 RepID=W7QBJ8_9ALTE|nr:ATP-binding protein [Catenovulum agarivorans]EWH09346.1 sensor histidine kinase [Catenovulum agarivorans DS-2]
MQQQEHYMLSLKTRISAGLILVLMYGMLAIGLSVSLPSSNYTFSTTATSILAQLPNQNAFEVAAFITPTGEIEAEPTLGYEEPDILPDYASLNQFFQHHQALHDALVAGRLQIRDTHNNITEVLLDTRSIFDLPGLFWLQLICGLAGMVMCLMVWVPAKRSTAINAFTLTGLSYVMFSSAAAVYSTRELFISSDLFVWLSGLNHFGALLFSASLSVFIWNYPVKSPSPWLTRVFYAAFFCSFCIDQAQLVTSPVEGFHLWVMGIFLTGLLGSLWQWWQTRGQPIPRAASRWIVVSILAGTAFFAGGMILPAILQTATPASQGLLFTTFLLMYAGMATGVVRYQLFDLDRWWFALWGWLLGGLAIMLADMLLVSLLSLSGPVTLTLSVALVGWLYFPLRQYAWKKWFMHNQRELDKWLANALPAMLVAQQSQNRSGLEDALNAVFHPLSIEEHDALENDNSVSLLSNGQALKVIDTSTEKFWLLQHAQQGSRLFNAQDVNIAKLVLALYKLVAQAQVAFVEGAKEERYRIRRDMHDDLGAKLLHLLHKSDPDSKPLVRDAIRDLRNLLKDMEGESLSFDAACIQWREETTRRCNDHGAKLAWQAQQINLILGVGQYAELTRIVREAVTNALKHADCSNLTVTFAQDAEVLRLVVDNDGVAPNAIAGEKRGLAIMSSRAQKLGGKCSYHCRAGHWQACIELSLASLSIGANAPAFEFDYSSGTA